MRALAVLVLVAVALAPGCSCSERGNLAGGHDAAASDAAHDGAPPDGGARDGGQRDGTARDGGGDAGTCDEPWTWRLEPRMVAEAWLVPGTPPRMGVAERLAVRVWLDSSCEVLARIDLVPMEVGACCVDYWMVNAWAWTADGCEPMDGPSATWIVTIGGREHANPQVVIDTEDPSNDWLLLEYTREGYAGPAPPYPLCNPMTPPGSKREGSACATDCECEPGLACIGFYAGVTGAPTWTCLRPCNDTVDCGADGTCRDQVEGPARVCDHGDQCTFDADCPPGFSCAEGFDHFFCLDERPFVTGQDCACDTTCPVGQRCTVGLAAAPTCEIICQRDLDCPSGYSEIAYECGSESLCVPLGYL
ncbi:MAG: hypothetical protein HY906_21465 [Deltaproteobacteria bacterium]|nr:hypothetical protein [Deltaproteobacteria bacterium]